MAFWTDRNVLVTGCTGLLGSCITEALVQADANVVGLVRDRVPRSHLIRSNAVDSISIVSGKIEDYHLVERCLNEYQIQTVFHLAAQTIVGIANQNPLSTFESNVRGTWNLLEACRTTSWVEQIVVASSDKAYGEHQELPYSEDNPLLAKHPYDVSKACADMVAHMYAESYQLPVCVTRFGNLFGSGDSNFDRLIPGTIRSVIRGESPIIRSDGKFSRDYIYIEDAASAYMTLVEGMSKDPTIIGQAFNFSYESPLSALEVVNIVLSQMGRTDLEPQILNAAHNEIPHQYLSSQKARNILNWQPNFSFETGLKRTIPWYKELLEGGTQG